MSQTCKKIFRGAIECLTDHTSGPLAKVTRLYTAHFSENLNFREVRYKKEGHQSSQLFIDIQRNVKP